MVDPGERLPGTQTEGDAPTEGVAGDFLSAGQLLGDRYQVRRMLGAGGMGEVWQAFDLKLRVEVALKALRADIFAEDKRIEGLRREVRAAREVVSPNVCRIFDLEEVDGHELVSMEYVDGATLLEVLKERGPLELKEAQDIASQLLAGLEAIHAAGLVHRDIKPENIMLTRTGRVVVMDFGIARGQEEGAGTVSGTPAYMAPEQGRGGTVDARTDVYAAGVVLAEMVSPEGVGDRDSRESLWEGVRQDPPKIADTPWAPVLRRAVAKGPEQRYNSAHTLTRALEEITLRVEGADDLNPYPGLASFTEDDAEYFFGREAEVEQMWRRLEGPARLLALVGPSGAGKTSFLRAGLVPSAGAGWGVVRCTPGDTGLASLRRAVIPELAGDVEALEQLATGDEDATAAAFARWRKRHDRALVIVDQFEELFTQNTSDDQRRVASVLGRLVLGADVHVLLGMRDDFLFRCHDFDELSPITSELTLLGPPVGPALRRALVQPAAKCGYRFSDDELVDEMLAEVEGERGALPLLAFAMARLWEKRDRQEGLLTREAYEQVGGVEGALAQHAEQTLESIGSGRLPIVRELFRNLVTAERTRAVREWDELLSVFDERETAQGVLRALIDARLLTSYEVEDEDGRPHRRVEIVHESLLAAWPRLVRWQTQDADAAQLRDQLRQAARTWDDQGRSDDTLWTGSAYREFASWRERYPGGLSEAEEAFARAMTALAGRRLRRRRVAVTAVLVITALVAAVTTALWRRSVLETRRAEAAVLLSQAQVELESYPSAAVAYATASLELSDSPEARRLALAALWKGPTALVINEERTWMSTFTPDGEWLVQSVDMSGHPPQLRIIGVDGKSEILEKTDDEDTSRITVWMGQDSGIFLSYGTGGENQRIGLWSAPERRLLAEHISEAGEAFGVPVISSQRRALILVRKDGKANVDALSFDGSYQRLGVVNGDIETMDNGGIRWVTDFGKGGRIWMSRGHDVFVITVGEHELSEPRRVFRQESSIRGFVADPLGRFITTIDVEGQARLWDINASSPPKILPGPPLRESMTVWITDDGSLLGAADEGSESGTEVVLLWTLAEDDPRFLRRFELGVRGPAWPVVDHAGLRVAKSGRDPKTRVWSLRSPADSEPLILARSPTQIMFLPSFSPDGRWLATSDANGLILWPLEGPYPAVIRRHGEAVWGLAFGPEGRWLASSSWDGTVRLWPLEGDPPSPGRVLFESPPGEDRYLQGPAVTPDGEQLLVGSAQSSVWLVPRNAGEPQRMPGFRTGARSPAFSPDGRLAAAVGEAWGADNGVIRVWKMPSGEEIAALNPIEGPYAGEVQFTGDREILTANDFTLRRWNLDTGESDLLYEGRTRGFAASAHGRRVVVVESPDVSSESTRAVFLDLEIGGMTPLEARGDRVTGIAMDAGGTIAITGDADGVIRVGPPTDEEPHLLLGHEGVVQALAIDPLGRWIASGGQDGTVRLWPMPDLSKPPLHTLPRQELIAKLKALTNLRVVRDEESSTGWKLEVGPFPGWETVPEW